ncbi:MAG: transposase [bacterium]|jgi:putative transposase
MIKASMLNKQHFYLENSLRDFLHTALLQIASEAGWTLQAWAVMSNHYHFVAEIKDAAKILQIIGKLHSKTAAEANGHDKAPGRRVWYQYRDTRLTFEKSWLVRLKYVSENPVKHGLVQNAIDYPYCSAA